MPEGILLRCAPSAGAPSIDGEEMVGYATQLVDDGYAELQADGYLVSWEGLFAALSMSTYVGLREALKLPDFTNSRPSLISRNSLTDSDFSIAMGPWRTEGGRVVDYETNGPILTDGRDEAMMRPEQWALFGQVISFSNRSADQRGELAQRQAWGRIRSLALQADAKLDDFLMRDVVLSPERLDIGLRKSDAVKDDRVIEVEPTFSGAPSNWIEVFDRTRDVRDRYDIPTPDGIVQVLVNPKVKTVLQEVKRMPGRRIAGARAEAFLVNPFAALGVDAGVVIEEAQFEQAREAAGLDYERFSPAFERDGLGYPQKVGLLIETAQTVGPTASEVQWLTDDQLDAFVTRLRRSIEHDYQLVAWEGYDLLVDGDAERHLSELSEALRRRSAPATLVSYAQVHDLSGYSARVEGIGVEKPYYSPYIAKKKDDEGWFPENVTPVIVYTPGPEDEPVAVPTSKPAIEKLKVAVGDAERSGKESVSVPWLPKPMALSEAKNVVSTFEAVFHEIANTDTFAPEKQIQEVGKTAGRGAKKQLVLRANIQALDYEELRREALQAVPARPILPQGLRAEFALLPHQEEGLAWLQHLFKLQAEYQVRGAILADDMGLGKTLQLLSLMAWLLEKDVSIAPMLVVAPVSLLENWAEEASKFFTPGTLPILTAYGDSLNPLRVPRAQIDTRLVSEDGLVKFLRPDWIGDSKLVLTTYETLRDWEFSFSAQKWSLMVCDEAQRIKNPAAIVTRAAKKQNVGFRIACTGTPVENTLADMWCLFDYVQPGLLGALNDFGQRYRKPIEAKSEEERARVEELRAKIDPQILRRLKTDVAKDLPPKIIVDDCRSLTLSAEQRALYSRAIDSFKNRGEPDSKSPFKNHLGLLHYLRLVCTDPRPYGLGVFKAEPVMQYRQKAPKLDWLLKQLADIRSKSEKAIVFCEFREIQRLLQHYIDLEFNLRTDIINGDTSAAASHTASRQKRIKAFQDAPGFGVIILSPVAVGFGVNIQAANHVIHYTRTWNPAKEDQATDRAYRIGQTKPVFVYYPVVQASDFATFDVKLDELLTYKRKLAEDMLNGSGDIGPSEFDLASVVPSDEASGIDERVTLDMAQRMTWQYFECLVGALWAKLGYECYRTPSTNDNGVDIVALNGRVGRLVQTKSSGLDGASLGWDAVKEVVGGEAFYRRRHPGVEFGKVCVTNQFFNRQAHENASLNGVELIDQPSLGLLLEQYEVTMLDVERMLFADWKQVEEVV